jgi:hypothetical protein
MSTENEYSFTEQGDITLNALFELCKLNSNDNVCSDTCPMLWFCCPNNYIAWMIQDPKQLKMDGGGGLDETTKISME